MRKIKLGGIYRLTHIPSECYYIGLSSDIFGRWGNHYHEAKMGKHSSQLDFSDPTEWRWEILEYCSKTQLRESTGYKGKKLDQEYRNLLLGKEKFHMSQHSVTYALNTNKKYFAQ